MNNKMTVKELIEILKKYKEDDIVTINGSGCIEWSWSTLCVNEDEIMDYDSNF